MKITALVENKSNCELTPVHGLALYIETEKHKLLFDLGPDDTLLKNAEKRGIDLAQVDTVVISHGHFDHGGALAAFLKVNHTAKIYVQRRAFEKHFSKSLGFLKVPIGLDRKLADHPQIVLTDGDYQIDEELRLFTVTDTSKLHSTANDTLYDENGKDGFAHEQDLMIFGEKNALIMGCGHCGVVNILERAKEYRPQICVGGYHLMIPVTKKSVPKEILDGISEELKKYGMDFYTCHCTGEEAFQYLSARVPRMRYLSCGEELVIS
ncbi:MAG: MBL fold metallo-hydrolase [Oscillibacter sp.]|nr:MBL fold metallo-hydrolase [Oscillibacter sp.]